MFRRCGNGKTPICSLKITEQTAWSFQHSTANSVKNHWVLSPEQQFVNTHPLFGFQLVNICPFGRQIFSTKLWQVDKPLSTAFNRFERYKFYFLNVNKLQTPNSNRTNRIFPRKYLEFCPFSTVSTPPTTTTILFLYFLYTEIYDIHTGQNRKIPEKEGS